MLHRHEARRTIVRAGCGLCGGRCISLFRLCDSRYVESCASAASDACCLLRAASIACRVHC